MAVLASVGYQTGFLKTDTTSGNYIINEDTFNKVSEAESVIATVPNKLERLARNAANSNIVAQSLVTHYDDDYEKTAQWSNIMRAMAQNTEKDKGTNYTLENIGQFGTTELENFVAEYAQVYDGLSTKNKDIMSNLMNNLDNYNVETFSKELTDTLDLDSDSPLYKAYMQLWNEQQQDATIRVINALGTDIDLEPDDRLVLDKETYLQNKRDNDANYQAALKEKDETKRANALAALEAQYLAEYESDAQKLIEKVTDGDNSLLGSVLQLSHQQMLDATTTIAEINEIADKTTSEVQKRVLIKEKQHLKIQQMLLMQMVFLRLSSKYQMLI